MYDIDPKPNSDQTYCDNCENIVDKLDITETDEGDTGCTECIEICRWCGNSHFAQDMYLCPWFNRICNDCVKTDDYKTSVKNMVLKESLRYYFDHIDHKRIERTIIEVAQTMGFTELVHELKNDL